MTPTIAVREIRDILSGAIAPERVPGKQRFFKEEIQFHGGRTADLRRLAHQLRKFILREHELDFLVQVADRLFKE